MFRLVFLNLPGVSESVISYQLIELTGGIFNKNIRGDCSEADD
jgi:hypothetical protein